MQHPSKLSAGLLAAIIIVAGFVSIAWFQNPGIDTSRDPQDTVPHREKKTRTDKEKHKKTISGDMDENLEKIDRALDKLDAELDGRDWDKMNKELRESLDKINPEKMEREIEQAMKSIDEQKIRLETEAALKKVDWDRMQQDIQRAMQDAKNSIDLLFHTRRMRQYCLL